MSLDSLTEALARASAFVDREKIASAMDAYHAAQDRVVEGAPVPVTASKPTEDFDINQIVDLIHSGQIGNGISKALGVSQRALDSWIRDDEVRVQAVDIALENLADNCVLVATKLLSDAGNKDQLAIAKERASHLRWFASKLRRNRYGEAVKVDGKVESQVHISFGIPSRAKTIDGTARRLPDT